MVFHPPMLYMGYVGFSVAFAFAVAALLIGGASTPPGRAGRAPGPRPPGCFLTIGIALGSWWAYYELGWGGWWFWDPVENASFMPWLVGTALIHSLAVTEKRGAFKSWTVLLAILAFSLSLLGTFLVRSGVLSSVHAFATDPTRGLFILAFLVVVVGGSLTLYAWRAPKVGLGGALRPCLARIAAAGQQRAAGGGHRRGAAGHAVPAGCWTRWDGQDLGRPAVLRRRVRAADGAGGLADGHRPAGALERNGQFVTRMHPEKRVYRVQQNPMTEAAISPGLLGDLYVSLGEPVDDKAWIVRLYVKPFVNWIWGGCLLMAFGGALAATDRRYRQRQTAPAGTTWGAETA
jgi:cytochrome c biogenesis factor